MKHFTYTLYNVVVQFYPWFKFYFPKCFKLIIIHYHTTKQRELKFKPQHIFVAQLYKQWPYLAKLEECNQQAVLWCYYVLTVAIWIMSLLGQEAWNWGLPFSRMGPMKPWLTKHYQQMLTKKEKIVRCFFVHYVSIFFSILVRQKA